MLTRADSDHYVIFLGYWRGLWSSLDFADQALKECVNVIHTDIVEIWNLNDKTRVRSLRVSAGNWLFTKIQYLSGSEFKARMSHVVKDLAGSAGGVPVRCVCYTCRIEEVSYFCSASPDFAEWVYDLYRGR